MDFYLQRLHRELEQVMQGRTAAMVQAPPGKWNSLQILAHLLLTYKNTNRGLAKCLERGAPLATPATIRHRLATLLVVRLGYFPEGAKAPERAVPRGLPGEDVRGAILDEIVKMGSGLDACEGRFGAATKIMDHPVLGPLTAKDWRKFHWLHGHHHIRQIRERAKL